MQDIPSPAEWTTQTYSAIRRRSEELKAVDTALTAFWNAKGAGLDLQGTALRALVDAFEKWKRSKEPKGWQQSVRARGAKVLDRALQTVMAFAFPATNTPGDFRSQLQLEIAERALEKARAEAVQTLFKGKSLESKLSIKEKLKAAAKNVLALDLHAKNYLKHRSEGNRKFDLGKGLHDARFGEGKEDRTLTAGAKTLAFDQHEELEHVFDPGPVVQACAGEVGDFVEGVAERVSHASLVVTAGQAGQAIARTGAARGAQAIVTKTMGWGGWSTLASIGKAAPLLGAVLSAKETIEHFRNVSKRKNDRVRLERARDAVPTGDATVALDAIDKLLAREIRESKCRGTISGSEFAAGLTFPGLAPGSSILAAAAQLAVTLYEAQRDYREHSRANAYLKRETVDATVFSTAPVLGAYFLVCSTRSHVLNFLASEIGDSGWMYRVESLNKRLEPVIATARRLIAAARYELPGMPLLASGTTDGWTDAQRKQDAAFKKQWRKYN